MYADTLASSCASVSEILGEGVHGRVVAQAGTDVGHLLDQHRRVLAGQLREGAVRATGAGGQVAGTTDLVGLFTGLGAPFFFRASIFSPSWAFHL
jgi:hypothetical protein